MKPTNSAGIPIPYPSRKTAPIPYSRYDEILKFKDDDTRTEWLSFINQLDELTIKNKRRFLLIA